MATMAIITDRTRILSAKGSRYFPRVVIVLVFLAIKELAGSKDSKSAQRVARFLIIPIIPLLISFVLMVVFKVIETLA